MTQNTKVVHETWKLNHLMINSSFELPGVNHIENVWRAIKIKLGGKVYLQFKANTGNFKIVSKGNSWENMPWQWGLDNLLDKNNAVHKMH